MSAVLLERETKTSESVVEARPGMLVEAALAEDEALYEVEYGRRVEKLMSAVDSAFASELGSRLFLFLQAQRSGRVIVEGMFILDTERDLRRRPDVASISAQRWPLDKPLPAQGDWPVVPDLAVEVVSPYETVERLTQKVDEYFRYGARQVWVVMPRLRRVYVYSSATAVRILTEQEELEGGEVVPGFRLKLSELFAAVPVETSAS
ncbi:hypothetical protein HRbin36_01687 [bacterium HR36]|nr:hypothetical protein HRbin36_01687 [bacterium HR36]